MPAANATFTGPEYYDALLGPYTFGPFAAELAARLPPGQAGPVLEVACGTGLVTRQLRARLAPSAQMIATDLSPAMLEFARRNVGSDGIEWREANAQSLPFEAGTFAAVVCGFGIMFVPDRTAGLKEMRRVLRPQGLLLLTVWDRIEENPAALAFAEVIEGLFPGDAEMRFRTPYEMHEVEQLRAQLAAAGFGEIRIETQRRAITGADPRQFATGQLLGTPRAALIAKRGLPMELVIDKVTAALEAAGGNPYTGYAQAHVVEARAV
jgi:ubiquinone/menaquinone biosynthesis C-methylase UbiE